MLQKTTPNQSSDEPWKRAYELAGLELTLKEYTLLQAKSVDGDPTYRSVIEDATLAQIKRRRNQRTKFHRIIKGLDTYARIVDVAIQDSPEITALVWAGARFLLQIYLNYEENMEKLEDTLETIVTAMAKCEFYATLYEESLHMVLRSAATTDALESGLKEALPEFYCTVLVFTVKAKKYFSDSVIEKTVNSLMPFEFLKVCTL
ncbi:Similar to ankyrin repeat-containing protein [Grosmannia clavigera kw1407]; acc. no. EFX01602 [Pyronema omphalodes CBS 100304]|uniref:Similar to ankyrin repeat-containing protein [Grosmannia clavigera kw1407] acc. no. EFX01602 n=1 Tax=Pyronema omphalodes (strain CBS 100304) TaxID=1076935 RepID=U4LP10_PYROM|nr:Similar to ankyrin repeat-containing protein [Grosmannia clavigera kw1407]; acc. no. EFX01602 [Pyronema omphalodes CBS 100304]